jgi:hypothetical protein
METTIELTRSEIFEIFKEWVRGYRENPELYSDVLRNTDDEAAESYTKYFLELADKAK